MNFNQRHFSGVSRKFPSFPVSYTRPAHLSQTRFVKVLEIFATISTNKNSRIAELAAIVFLKLADDFKDNYGARGIIISGAHRP